MSETTTEIKNTGDAQFEYDFERAIVGAFTAALQAREDEDLSTPDAAFKAVDSADEDILSVERYMAGGWQDDAPEDRPHHWDPDARVRDIVNTLVEQWGTLTDGAETARVESTRDGIRVVITRA